MEDTRQSELRLRLKVRHTVMVVPRCLQILSRRGYMLMQLGTEPAEQNTAVLTMTLHGNRGWHQAIPHLLSKVVDVEEVTVQEKTHA